MQATFYTRGWERGQIFQLLSAKLFAIEINSVLFVAIDTGRPANRRQ